MSVNRAAYFEALGLKVPPANPGSAAGTTTVVDPERDARHAALKRSHEIRQFEIELYWKRATYFWVLQAAVFTALGLIWKDDAKKIPEIVSVALAALGLLTAAAGWFSAQGSKFWQENWERHIDMLEEEFEGKLHQTAWIGTMGVRWSVSNINDRLILFFAAFWLIVFGIVSAYAVPHWGLGFACSVDTINLTETSVVLAFALTALALFWLYKQKTNLRGFRPSWEAENQIPEVQHGRPRLFGEIHGAPFVVKRGQRQ